MIVAGEHVAGTELDVFEIAAFQNARPVGFGNAAGGGRENEHQIDDDETNEIHGDICFAKIVLGQVKMPPQGRVPQAAGVGYAGSRSTSLRLSLRKIR